MTGHLATSSQPATPWFAPKGPQHRHDRGTHDRGGVDGSEASIDALCWASRQGDLTGGNGARDDDLGGGNGRLQPYQPDRPRTAPPKGARLGAGHHRSGRREQWPWCGAPSLRRTREKSCSTLLRAELLVVGGRGTGMLLGSVTQRALCCHFAVPSGRRPPRRSPAQAHADARNGPGAVTYLQANRTTNHPRVPSLSCLIPLTVSRACPGRTNSFEG